jgi:multidrug resistance efflux pump
MRLRSWYFLGLLGLAASLVGGYWMWHVSPTATGVPSEAIRPGARAVVCFGHVDVEGGLVGLSFSQAGRVAEVLVREGTEVSAGAVLVRLDDRASRLRLVEMQGALKAAQAQLVQAREAPEQHRARQAQQQAALEAVRCQVSAARHTLSRRQQLSQISQLSAEEVSIAADQLRQLEAQERAELARLLELERHDPWAEVQRAEAELATGQARLEQARHVLEECSLTAPCAGRVLRIQVSSGDGVNGQPGQPAVQFCPDRPRLIRAEVEQEFACLITPGQVANVEDDVPDGTRWQGRVVRLSAWYTRRRSPLLEPLQQNDVRTLECLIELEPGSSLRLGQRVRVLLTSQNHPGTQPRS